ncbi:predicted protein [Lichtheimia corymbifera JMRC:FSU:9682]|uniref:Uncharacterized protein n=1 Tax=Lichtheimia corymbifera JMRC:FSU:9682 TaxID=1263082 RepID=A0A068S8Z1_9FUNG|nr:predicted protein [Lichtheimia corymbifera JMRC:FSU:9682]
MTVPELFKFPTSSTPTLFPLPRIPNCCPIQVQLQPANDCSASTHHVKPTTLFIRLSLTEWQVPWRVHHTTTPAFLDTPPSLYNPIPPSNVTAFIPAVAISKVFIAMSLTAFTTLVTSLQHTLLHAPLPQPNVTAGAIRKTYTVLSPSYL